MSNLSRYLIGGMLGIILFIALLIVCELSIETGEEKIAKWISEHPKPIVCKFHKQSLLAEKSYTLIDANGEIYSTGFVDLTLPDTLK